jgi:hypothetical protein
LIARVSFDSVACPLQNGVLSITCAAFAGRSGVTFDLVRKEVDEDGIVDRNGKAVNERYAHPNVEVKSMIMGHVSMG